MNTTGSLLLYYRYCPYFTTTTLLYYFTTGAALPSVSPINAGIPHAENAVSCIVERDVTEVTWSFLTVARP
jgi:hypothetical protein